MEADSAATSPYRMSPYRFVKLQKQPVEQIIIHLQKELVAEFLEADHEVCPVPSRPVPSRPVRFRVSVLSRSNL